MCIVLCLIVQHNQKRPEEGISSPRTGVQMVGILVSN